MLSGFNPVRLMSSVHFQASRMAKRIAGMEIFRSKHCGMLVAKHFEIVFRFSLLFYFYFYFFLPGLKHCWHQPIRSEQAFPQWLCSCQSDEGKFAFIYATLPSMESGLLYASLLQQEQSSRELHLLIVKQAEEWRVSLLNFQPNVSKCGTRISAREVN